MKSDEIQVPFDSSADAAGNLTDKQFSIAMLRLPATDKENYKGPIFFNFGGPGDATTSSLASLAFDFREGPYAEALAGYDLVAFDPRGVGNTLPAVSCFTSREDSLAFAQKEKFFDVSQSDDAFVISDAQHRLLSENCADNAADLLPFIGTVYGVEDLRMMVEAYGYSDKLNFAFVFL